MVALIILVLQQDFLSYDMKTTKFTTYILCLFVLFRSLVFNLLWLVHPLEARLFLRDHFYAARFVVALFGVAHFVVAPFWSGTFGANFTKIIFFFCFLFQFF